MESFKNIFSNNLTTLMKINDKTQQDIAEALNVNRASVSYWMRGLKVPRADKIDALCSVLSCTREDLLGTDLTEQSFHLRKTQENVQMAIETLNEEGCRKVLEYIEDLGDRYKKKGGESADPPETL